MKHVFKSLGGISWHKVDIRLKNTRNIFAREHPLSIFQGMFKFAAAKKGVTADFFYHPVQEQLASRIHKNREYDLELIFPNASPNHIEEFIAGLEQHLKNKRNNFTLLHAGPPQSRCLADLEKEWQTTSFSGEVCLDFYTPLPFKPKSSDRRWIIAQDVFFRCLTNRVKRFYNIDLPDATQAWREIRILPYYWQYTEHRHKSRSNSGKQFINGAVGPLYLRGPVENILPLLLVCSELHAGRRTAAGQGYYVLRPNRPFFDPMLNDSGCFQRMIKDLDKNSDRTDEIVSSFIDVPGSLKKLHDDMLNLRLQPEAAIGFEVKKEEAVIGLSPHSGYAIIWSINFSSIF